MVSLVRAECVQLAHAMVNAGRSDAGTTAWLETELNDPLPEVRFAMAMEE
jgi:hypothetical protein